MSKSLIIADDLTGANATGVLLKKRGYKTYTVLSQIEFNKEDSFCDCILCPTDSRALNKDEAYSKVKEAFENLDSDDTVIYSKRIDSTLRGNIGSEIDAMLDYLGSDYITIVVPSFPSSGRIVCGGYMLVNSIPLHKTSAATDPRAPVHKSNVCEIIREQTKYKVTCLDIKDLRLGTDFIISRIKELKAQGNRVLVFDSINQDDIDEIADAVIASGLNCALSDPGPFSASVIKKKIILQKEDNEKRVLVAIGSVNPVAKRQLEQLLKLDDISSIPISTKALVENEKSRNEEIERVVESVLNLPKKNQICCIYGEGIFPEKRIDFSEYKDRFSSDDLNNFINISFGEMVKSIVEKDSSFQGLYTCGGDITVEVSKSLQASAIYLIDEVLPLAAYGELIKGPFQGMKIITKGGMVGDDDALCKCVNYLKEKIN